MLIIVVIGRWIHVYVYNHCDLTREYSGKAPRKIKRHGERVQEYDGDGIEMGRVSNEDRESVYNGEKRAKG